MLLEQKFRVYLHSAGIALRILWQIGRGLTVLQKYEGR